MIRVRMEEKGVERDGWRRDRIVARGSGREALWYGMEDGGVSYERGVLDFCRGQFLCCCWHAGTGDRNSAAWTGVQGLGSRGR